MIDDTHASGRTSWVASANGHATFPIQNLPLGVFSPPGGAARGGVAIGDGIFDVGAALEAGLFSGAARDAAEAASGRTLNPLLEAGPAARQALRRRVFDILDAEGADAAKIQAIAGRLVHDAAACTLHLPARIGDFTDFFAGIHHARTAGSINRPENPLMPNYKYVPVAYHSRASSVRPSGGLVRRPNGQRKSSEQAAPEFGPSRNLDYELELGVWIGAGNEIGSPIPIAEASRHVAGFCLLNDWSARDIQAWESQPLGPFLSKSLSTFVSPWIVTVEALAPFRMAQPPRPDGDPAAIAISERCRRSGAWGLQHRIRGAAADAENACGRGVRACAVAVECQHAVLDRGADGGAPHLERLQPATGRSVRQRDGLRGPRRGRRAACWR